MPVNMRHRGAPAVAGALLRHLPPPPPARLPPLQRPPMHTSFAALERLGVSMETSPRCMSDVEQDAVVFDAVYGPRLHRDAFCTTLPAVVRECERMAAQVTKRTLRLKHLLSAHRTLLDGGGRLRQGLVHAGGVRGHYASYVPPVAASVGGLLDDLLAFMAQTDSPDMLTATVATVRLLQIHPFNDGNGRTARLLFLSLLVAGFGWRTIHPQLIGSLFQAGNHALISRSLHQIRTGDWTSTLALLG